MAVTYDKALARTHCYVDATQRGWGKGKKSGGTSIVCPVCKTGKLQYQISCVDGRIAGKCDTHGCVGWVE